MKVYKLRINYKSGTSMEAEFKDFNFDGRTVRYEIYTKEKNLEVLGICPIYIGVDEIESVWQISSREVKE